MTGVHEVQRTVNTGAVRRHWREIGKANYVSILGGELEIRDSWRLNQ
jgi:hypothetical protein